MSAYVIFVVDEEFDPQKMNKYRQGARPTLEGLDAKILTLPSCEMDVVEGEEAETIVIIEFPTMEKARNWYHSKEYLKHAQIRKDASKGRAFIIDGFKMPAQ